MRGTKGIMVTKVRASSLVSSEKQQGEYRRTVTGRCLENSSAIHSSAPCKETGRTRCSHAVYIVWYKSDDERAG